MMRISLLVILAFFLACSSNPRYRPEADAPQSRKPRVESQRETRRSVRTGQLVAAASSFLGTPYRYGGEDASGMDCSGLVWKAARQAWGMKLPRVSREQASVGMPVSREELKADDLVFFATSGGGINHVGIYAGDGRFVHASSSKGVSWASLDDRYWRRSFRQGRRLRP
jgi:probable lipoprotein NlpC